MLEREIPIVNRLGLHARASAKLVRLLADYHSQATLKSGTREVNAKSIMGVLLLAAGQGSTVLLRVEGPDEQQALAAVEDLFARRFDEEH